MSKGFFLHINLLSLTLLLGKVRRQYKVWNFFVGSAGLQPEHSSQQQLLQQWWKTKPRNAAQKLLLQATPIFIYRNLWKNRCACKYGGKSTNISTVIYAIYKDNYKILNTAFPQLNLPAKWTDLTQKERKVCP